MSRRHPLQASDPDVAEIVCTLYPNNTSEHVAEVLGCSVQRVYQLAYLLGCKKTPEFFSSDQSGRLRHGTQHPSMRLSRFKPGQEPWNKGRPFEAGGRATETQFKPGNRPHTWLPIGTLRISGGQLERKTSEAKGANNMRWTPVARLVWEAAHGPVPAGHLIVFKPGTKTTVLQEITLDRLECISRGENGRRNVAWNSQPETAPLVHLRGQIQRQVNRITKDDKQAKGTTP
jgi:hypothetical protein